jgi:hypothetical protein
MFMQVGTFYNMFIESPVMHTLFAFRKIAYVCLVVTARAWIWSYIGCVEIPVTVQS